MQAGPGDGTYVRIQEVDVQGIGALGLEVWRRDQAGSDAEFREQIEVDDPEIVVLLMVPGRLDNHLFNLIQAVTVGCFLGESPGCGQRQAGEKDQCVFHLYYRSRLMAGIRAMVE